MPLNKKVVQVLIVLLMLCMTAVAEQEETDKLSVGVTYDYERYSSRVPLDWLLWWAEWCPETTPETIFSGTYWSLEAPEPLGRIFVTAGHVLQINTTPEKIDGTPVDGKQLRITARRTRAYMGFLAYEVGRVGEAKGLQDIAFFLPRRSVLSRDIRPLELADGPPRVREKVFFFGFPSTSRQQVDTAQVTSVHEARGYFVLNKPVDAGYSGGPVFNEEGRVYGVITSTDKAKRQTTVMRIRAEMLNTIDWKSLAEYDIKVLSNR
jgi:CBS domain-containing protein